MSRYDRIERIDGLVPPMRRHRLELPDVQTDGTVPRIWRGMLIGLLLAAPVWAVVLLMVWLTNWRFFGGGS